jgi:ferritin-like metal-binding protein YciE
MTKIATIEDFLLHELADAYGAETQMLEALPDMIDAASNAELRAAFEEHLEQTEAQVNRLEEVFSMLEREPPAKASCAGMEGIIAENSAMLEEDIDPMLLDAVLIAGAQKAEHYEISLYGTLAALAAQAGREDIAEVLVETLEEEKETDERLTEIAESVVNADAVAA